MKKPIENRFRITRSDSGNWSKTGWGDSTLEGAAKKLVELAALMRGDVFRVEKLRGRLWVPLTEAL